jgi:hypothetical protein
MDLVTHGLLGSTIAQKVISIDSDNDTTQAAFGEQ